MNVIIGINSIGFHYECILIPFLFAALIAGLAKAKEKPEIGTIALLFIFPALLRRSPVFHIRKFWPTAHRHNMVRAELKKIPETASISTQTALHPHLTHRKDAFLFSGAPKTDYVIVDLSENLERYGTPNLLADVENDGRLQKLFKIFDQDHLLIWKKKSAEILV